MKLLHLKLLFILLAIVSFGFGACKKDPIDPSIPVPVNQQPNPLPASALLKHIRWAENDHYTIAYNDHNQPLQLISQYQFVEGDPTQIRTLIYDFQYDAQQRLSQVNQTGGWVTKYFYHGDLIHNVKDFYPGGALANETVFIYANNKIVQENYLVSNPVGEPPSVYKRMLGYDGKGNLIKVETFEQQADLSFKLIQTTTFSDFDNKVNTSNWISRYPFLPQVRWQFHNPGKETVQLEGDLPKSTTFAYTYNAQGLPISKTENRPNGTLTAQLQY